MRKGVALLFAASRPGTSGPECGAFRLGRVNERRDAGGVQDGAPRTQHHHEPDSSGATPEREQERGPSCGVREGAKGLRRRTAVAAAEDLQAKCKTSIWQESKNRQLKGSALSRIRGKSQTGCQQNPASIRPR